MSDDIYTGALGDDWFDPANWSTGSVPVGGETADLFGQAGADARAGGTITGLTVDLSGAPSTGYYFDPKIDGYYQFTPGLFADVLGTGAAPVSIEATADSGLDGVSGIAFMSLDGSIAVEAGQTLDVSGVGEGNSITINGDVTVGAGGTLSFEETSASGYPDPVNLTMNGTLYDNGGTVLFQDDETGGSGQIVIADGGTVKQVETIPVAGFDLGATFGSGGGTFDVSNLFGEYSGTIRGFGAGDTVVDYDRSGEEYPVEASYAGGVLTIGEAGDTETLSFSGDYALANFDVTQVDGVIDVTFKPCFVRGTSIACADGDRAVEDVSVGDVALLADRSVSEVVWVGTRRQHRGDVIRFRAGSLGHSVPRRDLVVSVDHGMFVGGVLVPAQLLVNGSSVVREQRETVTFFHVELAQHGVLLAEDAAAESYFDSGNRAQFGNCPFSYEPMDAAFVEPCAEMVFGGPRLEAIKAELATYAS